MDLGDPKCKSNILLSSIACNIFPFMHFRCLQLITQVKQDTENDILKHPCSKCNKVRTTILLPRLERKQRYPPTVVRNEYLSREALLMKLCEMEKQIKTFEPTSKSHDEHEMVMVIRPLSLNYLTDIYNFFFLDF